MCVLSILMEPDLGTPLRLRAGPSLTVGRTGGECLRGGIERFLIAVDTGLLAVGDPLVEVHRGLFLVEVVLQATRLLIWIGHRAGAPECSLASAAGRPMW